MIALGVTAIIYGAWIPVKAKVAQSLLERAWQESRATGVKTKAWYWADSWPIAKMTIPSLNFEAIVLKEAGGEGLAFGPVLLDQSAPLQTQGTAVISAHRDTHFRALADLRKGDIITVELMQGKTRKYQIDTMRIAPWNQSGIQKDTLDTKLVLSSCWPFDAVQPGPLRFIAEARPVQYAADLVTTK